MSDENVKQVIVVRADLKMPKGKLAAQVAHASMKIFFDRMNRYETRIGSRYELRPGKNMEAWMQGAFTKVCLKVNSEEELLALYKEATDVGLPTALITDAGRTCFNEPTITCFAIGPANEKKINKLTGNLKLL